MSHDVVAASDLFIECSCGHISVSRPGHDAHLSRHGEYTETPTDPTQDVRFTPGDWTGTVMSGLLSSRSECGLCGQEWHDGECLQGTPTDD